MELARVVGTVVATQKEETLPREKLLVLSVLDGKAKETGQSVVALDAIGAGSGEVVLFCTGSSARQTAITQNKPVDAVVMAIVDEWEIGGQTRYKK